MPYKKTKKGYFLLIINEKIDEMLTAYEMVNIRIEEV